MSKPENKGKPIGLAWGLVISLLTRIYLEVKKMAGEVQRLGDEVQEAKGVMASAAALIEGLAQFIRDNLNNPAALKQYADDLDASSNTLGAAVAANPLPEPPPVV
jgi:hypothetical protein